MRLFRQLMWASLSKRERDIILGQIEPQNRSEIRRIIAGNSIEFPIAFDKHQCIFIHIPKNAGTSVKKSLGLDSHIGHQPLSWYQNIDPIKCKNYFKFCFVRNPWDRLVSSFFYLKNKKSTTNNSFMLQEFVSRFSSFDEFVLNWLNPENIYKDKTFFPQHYFMRDRMGMLCMDFVGRVENIQNDLDIVLDHLGITHNILLQHVNKSERDSYRKYYTTKSKRIVEMAYSEDIALFNYKF